jgi:hypothetical protein
MCAHRERLIVDIIVIIVVDHWQSQATVSRAQWHIIITVLLFQGGGGRNQTAATHWLRPWHNGENFNGATTPSTRTSGPTC